MAYVRKLGKTIAFINGTKYIFNFEQFHVFLKIRKLQLIQTGQERMFASIFLFVVL